MLTTFIISFNPLDDYIMSLCDAHLMAEETGLERFPHLPKVTELVSDRAGYEHGHELRCSDPHHFSLQSLPLASCILLPLLCSDFWPSFIPRSQVALQPLLSSLNLGLTSAFPLHSFIYKTQLLIVTFKSTTLFICHLTHPCLRRTIQSPTMIVLSSFPFRSF